MGAVCGIYYGDGKPVFPETGAAMMDQFQNIPFDRVGTWQKENAFLGCHIQYITPESVGETLPYHDELSGLTITADAIIDNRGDLLRQFDAQDARQDCLPDSQLILQAYRKWGVKCPEYLRGDFAFAIWDEKERELFCAVDHTGTRAFYYCHTPGLFAFSTLIRPLFTLPEIDKKYDNNWIADMLAMPCVMHQLDPELTPYRNVRLLPAGCRLIIRAGRMVKETYWQATGKPIIKLKSDRDYEEAFRLVLGEAVRCRMRSIRPVGVMMSGGLDSTSVASLAARELAGQGRRLLAFTAVPMHGYRDWLPTRALADESAYVEAVKDHVGNIDVVYCRSEGKHSLSDTDRLLARLEQPYKIFENLFWNEEIMRLARERNVGVLLNGGAGNRTISWGTLSAYLLYLFRTGRWRRFFLESRAFIERQPDKPEGLKRLLMTLLPYTVLKNIYRYRDPGGLRNVTRLSPVNPDFARRMSVEERFRCYHYDPLFIRNLDSRRMRTADLGPDFFSHLAVLTTKMGLAHRMVQRDPTMDKQVIEFCIRVPEDQYIRHGKYRYLVRRAMGGLLPEKVLWNTAEHGRQSADWAQRLQPFWPDIRAEIGTIGVLAAEREYLDVARIRAELGPLETIGDSGPADPGLRMLLRSLIFSRFLRQEELAP